MIDLKEFVKASIADITGALEESGANGEEWILAEGAPDAGVSFDVAVTASTENDKGIKGKVSIVALELGVNDEGKNINETVSRVKFRVVPKGLKSLQ